MFRMSTSRNARAGRLSGVAIISVGLMLAGANAASAMTHDEAVAACQGYSTEAPPGQPSSFDICVQVNDTDWQAKNPTYEGSGPRACDGMSRERLDDRPSQWQRCMAVNDPSGKEVGTYEGSPSNPLPKAAPQKQAAKPKATSKSKSAKAPAKKGSVKKSTTKKR